MAIADNIDNIRQQIASACRRAGRGGGEVALMAVSKMHPAAALQQAYAAGVRLFGENRVQEWEAKSAEIGVLEGALVHLIGPLQSNKTTRAAELFDAVDTVASLKVAERLNGARTRLAKPLPVLIEVKLSHEPAKHGIAPDELPGLLRALAALDWISPRGLMTVPPWSDDAETARPYFRELRRLRDQAAREFPSLTELSMGMSGDFAVAIEEGSTCVRIGSAIFGPRARVRAPDNAV